MPKIEKPNQLELEIAHMVDFNGLELGVFSDGTGFLTGRGLASVCNVAPRVVNSWANEFDPSLDRRRDRTIARLLSGYEGPLYIKTMRNGVEVNAFPEAVCVAVLEYYAFETDKKNDQAVRNYRLFGRAGIRAFIYAALGYDPHGRVPDKFASYHQRLLLNPPPPGYFSVLTETAHVVITLIKAGLTVDSHTLPDGSIGQTWANYWRANGLAGSFGERVKHIHVFPDDYPQSAVEPEVNAYPIDALGQFRRWLDAEYLPKKFPDYIERKVKQGALPASHAELILAAFMPPPALGNGGTSE